MNGKRILATAMALSFCGLLCACAADNTLSARGSMDSRLKAVEGSLHKTQEELKALAGKQGQDDARVAELHKKLGELLASLQAQGLKTPAPLPAKAPPGSALGVGFARPGADASGRQPAPAVAAVPAAAPSPDEKAAGGEPLVQTPSGPVPASAVPQESRHTRGSRVGPAANAAPATPEAAIAADRGETPALVPPVAETPPQAPVAASGPAATTPPAPAAAAPPASAQPVAPSSLEVSTPEPKTSSLAPDNAETASPTEKAEYNRALQIAINGRTAEAKAAFDQFMAAHPKSPLTPNALYWVGESSYAGGDYQKAISEFERVARGWPGHHKAADSLYKVAMAQEKLGDVAAARATLERYLKDYPNAEMAGVARQKLQALPQ